MNESMGYGCISVDKEMAVSAYPWEAITSPVTAVIL